MLRKLIDCIAGLIVTAFLFLALLGWADRAMGATPPRLSLPTPYMIDTATLAYVDCAESTGTAVQIGGGRYITAAHVVTGTGCKIVGKPITIEGIDVGADWAVIRSETRLPFYVIFSCDRLIEGQSYFASGFALGNPWPVTTRLVAERYHDGGESYLRGAIINGMSGGSVVDADGVLHAINDSRGGDGIPLGGVIELADTPLCPKGKH